MSDKGKFVGVRVEQPLHDALTQIASDTGKSLSDVVRDAVEARIAGHEPAPAALPDELNPFSKLGAAARGSIQAQRDLANMAVQFAMRADNDETRSLCIHDALTFARLVAAHGHLEDQGLVIALLALQSEFVGEESVEMAEAIARVELIASRDGEFSEWAAELIPQLADGASPRVMEAAKNFAKQMEGSEA